MAFVLLVGCAQFDLPGQLGKFGPEDFARFFDDHFPAGATGDAAEDKQVSDFVEVREMRDGIAELDPDGFVDATRPGIARSHQALHFDELLGEFHLLRELQPGFGGQTGNALLAEVLYGAPAVAAPLVGGRVVTSWPTLSAASLDQGSLEITIDYRDVLTEILADRLACTSLATVVPGYVATDRGLTA